MENWLNEHAENGGEKLQKKLGLLKENLKKVSIGGLMVALGSLY